MDHSEHTMHPHSVGLGQEEGAELEGISCPSPAHHCRGRVRVQPHWTVMESVHAPLTAM